MSEQISSRASLYAEVTGRIVAELEAGRLPWIRPWVAGGATGGMPRNALTGRAYSGINVLILWTAAVDRGFDAQLWLTFRQAIAAGGSVRRGEKATTVCYADRFTPKAEARIAEAEHRDPRWVPFLKRFALFNIAQCEGLPQELVAEAPAPTFVEVVPRAAALIAATGAEFRIGGDEAFYAPGPDIVVVPPQQAFPEPIDWYRTAFHELGHWTGHSSRLDRDQTAGWNSPGYAREELVAEMAAAFTCASLAIAPKARHSDYIGAWLSILKADERAIFRAASQASRAADYLLAFEQQGSGS